MYVYLCMLVWAGGALRLVGCQSERCGDKMTLDACMIVVLCCTALEGLYCHIIASITTTTTNTTTTISSIAADTMMLLLLQLFLCTTITNTSNITTASIITTK